MSGRERPEAMNHTDGIHGVEPGCTRENNKEKLKSYLLSYLHTTGQSMWEMGVLVGLVLSY